MIEWPLILGSGMLGAAHCLGMCGPFALAVGAAAPSWRANLWRQAWYSAGRVFTYAVLGSAAACGGRWLAGQFAVWANIPAILALVAGCFLVIQGLLAAGVLPKRASDQLGAVLVQRPSRRCSWRGPVWMCFWQGCSPGYCRAASSTACWRWPRAPGACQLAWRPWWSLGLALFRRWWRLASVARCWVLPSGSGFMLSPPGASCSRAACRLPAGPAGSR